ncbi:MAG: hypothetical protein J6W11_00350 [Alphaproteobacteria bacterium]|nr:hypothetical protein [Alphaproteobacteria bacterium]
MAQIVLVLQPEPSSQQTILSAHLAAFLATAHQTALIDIEPQKHLLEMFVAHRHCFNLKHKQNLAVPAYFTYKKNILDEIPASFDFIVSTATDIQLLPTADIVLTFAFNQSDVNALTQKDSPFAQMLWQAKKERAKTGKNAFRHIIIPTVLLTDADINSLKGSASLMGYKTAPYFKISPAYADSFAQGLTVCDKDTSCLLKSFTAADFFARRNFQQILEFIWSDK